MGQQVLVGVVGDLVEREPLHAADVGDDSPALERLDDRSGDVVGGYGDHDQLRAQQLVRVLGRRRARAQAGGGAQVLLGEVIQQDTDAVRAQKFAFQEYVARLVADAGATPELGPQLAILAEGAQTTAAISGTPEAAHQARAAAETLLDAAVPARQAELVRS